MVCHPIAFGFDIGQEQDVGDLASLLLDQAHILDGEIPSDPAAFTRRLNAFVVRSLETKG